MSTVPDVAEWCKHRCNPDWCVSCLREEVQRLRKQVEGLCDRVAAQSELLSKMAEREQVN